MWKIYLFAVSNIDLTQPSWPLEAAFFSGETFVTNLGLIFCMYPSFNPSPSEGSDVYVTYLISSAVNTQTWGTTFSHILLLSDFFILWLLPGNREWIWFLIPKSVQGTNDKRSVTSSDWHFAFISLLSHWDCLVLSGPSHLSSLETQSYLLQSWPSSLDFISSLTFSLYLAGETCFMLLPMETLRTGVLWFPAF